MRTWYLIPARKGSKGLRFKNRKLLPLTVNQIPGAERKNIIVTTDDEQLIDYCHQHQLRVRTRPAYLATDKASMRDVIKDTIDYFNFASNDRIVVLYPTFPQRTFADIQSTLDFLNENQLRSCTGKKRPKDHPYLSLKKINDIFAKKLVDHPFYRRQDYPECFSLSHLVYVVLASEINNVDDLLLNEETGFRWVDNDTIDVDYEEDFLKYSNDMSSGIERFNPRAFEIDFDPFLRHFERYFQSINLLGEIGGNNVWLDCACGSGYGTAFLTNFAREVWGYDIDKSAVAHANYHYKNAHCRFTSDEKDLDKKKFDVIFSIETIEHMPLKDTNIFLRRCHKLLRDGGTLVITTPIVAETNLDPSNEFHFFECSLDDFVGLLNKNGFVILEQLLKPTTFTDGETKEQGYFKCQKSQ